MVGSLRPFIGNRWLSTPRRYATRLLLFCVWFTVFVVTVLAPSVRLMVLSVSFRAFCVLTATSQCRCTLGLIADLGTL
ncbi:hypothetical protein JAAARDRAFT_534774 [Jaapia argillacea MUCL 33604]|uniref:Uncharacterized protein n=1 Tax=Jaapia argillacea MUCL 33604 TaxID=933084 RepID=A0A067P8G4_9AGAM|nr:hypothetical protein JAAARDRAFT_534774 [Jaapia argillacea MUCL 33604]